MIAQIDFIEGVVAASNGESENKQVGMIFLGSVLQVEMGGKGGESVIPCHSCAQKKKRNDCLLLLFFFLVWFADYSESQSLSIQSLSGAAKKLSECLCVSRRKPPRDRLGAISRPLFSPLPLPPLILMYICMLEIATVVREMKSACLLACSLCRVSSRPRGQGPQPRYQGPGGCKVVHETPEHIANRDHDRRCCAQGHGRTK